MVALLLPEEEARNPKCKRCVEFGGLSGAGLGGEDEKGLVVSVVVGRLGGK